MNIRVLASGSNANCTFLTDGTTPLLLDAGIPVKRLRKELDFGLSSIAGALVTHSHQDHSRAVEGLLGAGVDCYMRAETAQAREAAGHHRLHIVEPRVPLSVGSWRVLAFDTPHDVPNLGYVLSSGDERILYLTDTPYCPVRIPGLTRILIEINYDLPILKANVEAGIVDPTRKRRILHHHMNLDTAKGFFRANDLSRVREIILLHLSDENSHALEFKRAIQALTGKLVRIA
jgi:phosphoribosyl 1,2-cyclic phosphodiesterase